MKTIKNTLHCYLNLRLNFNGKIYISNLLSKEIDMQIFKGNISSLLKKSEILYFLHIGK